MPTHALKQVVHNQSQYVPYLVGIFIRNRTNERLSSAEKFLENCGSKCSSWEEGIESELSGYLLVTYPGSIRKRTLAPLARSSPHVNMLVAVDNGLP